MRDAVESALKSKRLLKTGIVGSIVAAIGCFTPALVVLFGALGLSGLMGWWLDYFLLYPALAVFLAMTGYAIYRLRRNTGAACNAEAARSGAEA